jgi:hypothetical protein
MSEESISQEELAAIRARAHTRGYYRHVSPLFDALERAERERDEERDVNLALAKENQRLLAENHSLKLQRTIILGEEKKR